MKFTKEIGKDVLFHV